MKNYPYLLILRPLVNIFVDFIIHPFQDVGYDKGVKGEHVSGPTVAETEAGMHGL